MADDITNDKLQELLSQGVSQNEIARRTGISRSTLRKRLKILSTPQAAISVPAQEESTPEVHHASTPQALVSPRRADAEKIASLEHALHLTQQELASTVAELKALTKVFEVMTEQLDANKKALERIQAERKERAEVFGSEEFREMTAWWHERKRLAETTHDPEQEPQRQTAQVQKRSIEATKAVTALEEGTIIETVKRAVEQFFAGKAL